MNKIIARVANETEVSEKQVNTVIELLEEGNTIPFIARYRKEMTNNLDEVQIKNIEDQYNYLLKFNERKEDIIRLINEQDKMTDVLLKEIDKADTLSVLEDIYRPYRAKRKTLASVAKENGLEPLANYIMLQDLNNNVLEEAKKYISDDLDLEAVLKGAHEIIAESVSDRSDLRAFFRKYTYNNALLVSKVRDEDLDERSVYKMYYDYSEKLSKVVPHRILALNRAEKEKVLTVNIVVSEDEVSRFLANRIIINRDSDSFSYIEAAYEDAYKRFIAPAIARELRNEITEKAQAQAIDVFSDNLYNLLMQSPIKDKIVMGFDPAFRSGCKLAIIDEYGKVLKIEIIYPHATSEANTIKAGNIFNKLIEDYQVDLVAIGNGTASRESEVFVAENLKKVKRDVSYLIVSEAGASVYSASEIAREEFPTLQVEERSAISIARRVLDPLAELVKVEPKSIGVGQYQHDVPEKTLDNQLMFVVENAVNRVGADLNSGSAKLFEYISGLNKTVAQNIVNYRNEIEKFTDRKQLLKVPRLGKKSYEQAIGFLRIFDGDNILDSTGIHPESYKITNTLVKDLKIDLNSLGSKENNEKLNKLDIADLSLKYAVGEETLRDIVEALKAPKKDFRSDMSSPQLRSDVLNVKDLKEGLKLNGTVRNVVDFGAFVDVGLDNDGLVHISKISKSFVKHPSDILKVGDQVEVVVISFEEKTGKVQLSMID